MSNIKIRLKTFDDFTRVRTLIRHPMETGRNRDAVSGRLIPAKFINVLTLELNGQEMTRCRLGTGISRNPYFSFRIKGAKRGDRVRVCWHDNLGDSDSAEKIVG